MRTPLSRDRTDALATYDLQDRVRFRRRRTVSLEAAVTLLNDLNWYLVRFADAAFVRTRLICRDGVALSKPRRSARDDDIAPEETGRFLKGTASSTRTGPATLTMKPDGRRVNARHAVVERRPASSSRCS